MQDFRATQPSNDVLRGIRKALPLLLAVAAYGLVLGAQATAKQMTPAEVGMMTGLNFAGGSEFAAINLWANPLPMAMIILVTLLINSRHIVMGASLVPYLQHQPKRRVLPALFFMTDESWALSLANTTRNKRQHMAEPFSWSYYWGVCLPFYPVWVGASVAGSLIGPHLGNLTAYGFDIVFPAVFIVLLRGMWQGMPAARPWLASLVVAIATYLLVPGAWYMLTGTIAGLALAWYLAGETR